MPGRSTPCLRRRTPTRSPLDYRRFRTPMPGSDQGPRASLWIETLLSGLSRNGLLVCAQAFGSRNNMRSGELGAGSETRDRGCLQQHGRIGKTHDLTHNKQRRRSQLRSLRQVGYGCAMNLLMRGRSARNNCARRPAIEPRGRQTIRDLRIIFPWHVDRERSATAHEPAPICGIAVESLMSRDQDQSMRSCAMGERNLRGCGRTQRRRHTWNYFARNAGFAERVNFFASAPEDERIAALQANYLESRGRQLHQKKIDFFLPDLFLPTTLAHVTDLR